MYEEYISDSSNSGTGTGTTYGGITYNSNGAVSLDPKKLNLTYTQGSPDTDTGTGYTAPTTASSPGAVTEQDIRKVALDAIIAAMPAPISGFSLFTRAELDVPNLSNDDLKYILSLLEEPALYMGTLDSSNVILFQKEVITIMIEGADFQAAVIRAQAAIKANIYLYDEYGKPIKPATSTPGTPASPTASSGSRPGWVLIGVVILVLIASK